MTSVFDSSVVVHPDAQPITLAGRPGLPAILLLHGYTGYTGEMHFLSRRLNEQGYTVSVPRYPGHGTSGADFRRTGWRDWLWRAADAYRELAGRHEQVVVGGLSMGGVIASILAARFHVQDVVLLAPALQTVNPLVRWTPLIQYFVPALRKGTRSHGDEQDPLRRYLAEQYWDWNWPRQTASLYRLIRMARRQLAHLDGRVLTIVSRADDTVPVGVAHYIDERIASPDHYVVTLDESDHVVTNGCERDEVARAVVEWLRDRPAR